MSRYGWERGAMWDRPSANVREGAAPIRVVNGEHDPEFERKPVGFAPAGTKIRTRRKSENWRDRVQRVLR